MATSPSELSNVSVETTVSNDVYFNYAERQILSAIISMTAILGVTGNTLVILSVILSRKLRHTTNYFVLNLSFADLLTSLDLPLIVLGLLNGSWPLPDSVCIGSAILVLTCLTCSINCMTCVALNRYFLITKPIALYRWVYTPMRIVLAVVITWAYPLCTILICTVTGFIKLGFDPEFYVCTWIISESDSGYYLVFFFTSLFIQFPIIIWSYVSVFRHVCKHARAVGHMDDGPTHSMGPTNMRTDTNSVAESNNPQVAPRRNRNKLQIDVTKNLFFVVCVFTICITPFGMSLVLGQYGRRLYPIGCTILALNSCVNPIIYAAKLPQFRTVFKALILCRYSEIPERVRFC